MAEKRGGIRVRCPLGGLAPCIDDMCHSSDQTLCGLYRSYDFCDHGYDPDSCVECDEESDDDGSFQEMAQE